MHTEGSEPSEEVRQPGNRDLVAGIENLQHSQAFMWEELQSLHLRKITPQTPQGGQGPQGETERLNLDPLLNQRLSSLTEGPQASPYLTKEDIVAILLEDRKAERFAYIDTRSPNLEVMGRKPYPMNYTPPIFPKYDGIVWNARKHIIRYVDALTAYSHNHELRLIEFSKSLEGCAFTCYTGLLPGLVLSWNDMATQFMKKFFTLDEKLSFSNLL